MTDAPTETSAGLLAQGMALAAARAWPQAVALAEQALVLTPGDVQAGLCLGEWRLSNGQAEDALVAFLAVVDQAPANPAALRGAANTLLRLRRADDAMALATRAVAAQPSDAANHRALGQAHAAAGRWDEALVAMQAAMTRKPRHSGMLLQTARVQSARGHLPEALALAEASIAAEATRAVAWRLKSQLLYRMGDLAGSATAARRCILLQPAVSDGHYRLALALLSTDPANAAASAAEALRLMPDHQGFRSLLTEAQAAAALVAPPTAKAPRARKPAPEGEARPDRRKLKRAARRKAQA